MIIKYEHNELYLYIEVWPRDKRSFDKAKEIDKKKQKKNEKQSEENSEREERQANREAAIKQVEAAERAEELKIRVVNED